MVDKSPKRGGYDVINSLQREKQDGGHFARVTQWWSDGSPKRIWSKWGCYELLYSGGMNVWGSSSPYGTAQYFYKL